MSFVSDCFSKLVNTGLYGTFISIAQENESSTYLYQGTGAATYSPSVPRLLVLKVTLFVYGVLGAMDPAFTGTVILFDCVCKYAGYCYHQNYFRLFFGTLLLLQFLSERRHLLTKYVCLCHGMVAIMSWKRSEV